MMNLKMMQYNKTLGMDIDQGSRIKDECVSRDSVLSRRRAHSWCMYACMRVCVSACVSG